MLAFISPFVCVFYCIYWHIHDQSFQIPIHLYDLIIISIGEELCDVILSDLAWKINFFNNIFN